MRTGGTAAAIGLATGIFGGVIGYLIARLLVERLGIVEGPPAGVLLELLPSSLTVGCAFLGFRFCILAASEACCTEEHSGSMSAMGDVSTTI
jgi:uncharacterized protein YacL